MDANEALDELRARYPGVPSAILADMLPKCAPEHTTANQASVQDDRMGYALAPSSFKAFNDRRHAAGLQMRARIAAIDNSLQGRLGRLPTAREIAREMIPHLGVAPPLTVRAIQLHLRKIR
jgi:hypothetical protein